MYGVVFQAYIDNVSFFACNVGMGGEGGGGGHCFAGGVNSVIEELLRNNVVSQLEGWPCFRVRRVGDQG